MIRSFFLFWWRNITVRINTRVLNFKITALNSKEIGKENYDSFYKKKCNSVIWIKNNTSDFYFYFEKTISWLKI
jgi:hypothetical protein